MYKYTSKNFYKSRGHRDVIVNEITQSPSHQSFKPLTTLAVAISLSLSSTPAWSACTVAGTNNITCTGAENAVNANTGNDKSTLTRATTIITTDNDKNGIESIGGHAYINVDADTTVNTSGDRANGIYGKGNNGWGTEINSGATIITTGQDSAGIRGDMSQNDTTGYIVITTDENSNITTNGKDAEGIHAYLGSEKAGGGIASNGNVIVDAQGSITTNGERLAEGIYGAITHSEATGNIHIKFRGDKIETTGITNTPSTGGDGNRGILASQLGSGYVFVQHHGNMIKTSGNKQAHGIEVRTGMAGTDGGKSATVGRVFVDVTGDITTVGEMAHGIWVNVANNADSILVANEGNINVSGDNASAIRINSTGSGDISVHHFAGAAITSTSKNSGPNSEQHSDAIFVKKDTESTGNILTQVHGDITTTGSSRAAGIHATHLGTGSVTVYASGNISTIGDGAHGIFAESTLSDVTVTNTGTISTEGNHAKAIYAKTDSGNITVDNRGNLTTLGPTESIGIRAESETGAILIKNSGTITTGNPILATSGSNSTGISASIHNAAATADIVINNSGNIVINGFDHAFGIYSTNQGSGNVSITSTGADITTQNTGRANHGIEAIVKSGTSLIEFANGKVDVNGYSAGLLAWDLGQGDATAKAKVVVQNGNIDASKAYGTSAIKSSVQAESSIFIDASSQVHGGWSNGSEVGKAVHLSGASGELTNYGSIDAMSDYALRSATAGTATHTIDNYGTIMGYFKLAGEDTTFSNNASGSWNIRNFADTTGDGVRDSKAVAISDFGAGNDTVKNEATGTIRLSSVTGESSVDNAGEYVAVGALSMTTDGIVHGQLLNLNNFEHRGMLDLTDNGLAGDVFVISGGTAAGSYGGNQFLSDGGFIRLDTVLNEGDTNSLSDIVVLDDVKLGTNGATQVIVNRVDGAGGVTEGNGIKLIEVLGTADEGSFELVNVVKGGLYEYTLHQGAVDQSDNHVYLRNNPSQINPDVGSYLANQTAATGLFMHSLHDRLGEPQQYNNDREEGKAMPAVWLRGVAGRTKNEAAGGALKQRSVNSLMHLGGEMANWTGNGDNRYHLGVMGAYGHSETRSTSQATGSKVKSTVDGYGVGAYFTWYSNPLNVEGWYADVWSMYNWFNNKTEGSDKYHSQSWTTSLEMGYAAKLIELTNYDWMLEPQAQVAYNYYRASTIKDHNGLDITDSDANGVATRLGMRTYLSPLSNRNGAQPFVEMNWLYNSANNNMVFNGETISDDTPKNRFESKVGIQGEMIKNLQVYSYVGLQWGRDGYQNAEGQVGARYRF